ncbi:MAG: PilZ domain-containing protein, partial [Deltaproteobacteria bacterium]|nr:PilZ domain-containing protein [Deltaproteobacteria bacterium]
ETGVSVRLERPVVFDSVIGVELVSDYGEATRLKGMVVRNDRESDGSIVAGINFINMDREMKDGVVRQMFSPENSWSGFHEEGVPAGSWSFASQVLSAFLALFRRDRSLKRSAPRFFVSIPGDISAPGSARKGKTREISLSGLSMEVSGEETVPKDVLMTIQPEGSQTITVKGEVVWQVREKSKRLVGVRFSDPEDGRALWDMMRSR